jgi:hypothetical protein
MKREGEGRKEEGRREKEGGGRREEGRRPHEPLHFFFVLPKCGECFGPEPASARCRVVDGMKREGEGRREKEKEGRKGGSRRGREGGGREKEVERRNAN